MLFRMTLVAAAVVVSGSAIAAVARKYDIQELPTFCVSDDQSKCGLYSYAYDLNNAGTVVGYGQGPLVPDADDSDNDGNVTEEVRQFAAHAFRWHEGALLDLGSLGKNESYGFAINDDGAIVGRASKLVSVDPDTDVETIQSRAFRVVAGEEMVDIGTPTETVNFVSATDIGNDGTIIGYAGARVQADSARFFKRGFVKLAGSDDVILIPGLEEASDSMLRAVSSEAGKAVGYSYKSGKQRAIELLLSDLTTLTEIGDLGGDVSVAHAINEDGIIVGRSQTMGNKTLEGFVYDPTQSPAMRSIGLLNNEFTYSSANAVNVHGDVVGVAQAARSPAIYHAVFFDTTADELIDLNSRIDCAEDSSNRWTLTEALVVNDGGQIVGYGHKGNTTRAFMLTPSLDVSDPIQCESDEVEFENQSGGGAMQWIFWPIAIGVYWRRKRY